MVGKIGSILGRHNVNIASMHVGRRTRRGRAIVVLLLDEAVAPRGHGEVSQGGGGRLRPPHPARAVTAPGGARPRPWRRTAQPPSSSRGRGAATRRSRGAGVQGEAARRRARAAASACRSTATGPSTGRSWRARPRSPSTAGAGACVPASRSPCPAGPGTRTKMGRVSCRHRRSPSSGRIWARTTSSASTTTTAAPGGDKGAIRASICLRLGALGRTLNVQTSTPRARVAASGAASPPDGRREGALLVRAAAGANEQLGPYRRPALVGAAVVEVGA